MPPTGRNCVKSSPVRQLQSSPVSMSSTEASQFTAKKASPEDQATELQQEILKQLHQVNSRLDIVGQDMVTVKQAAHKQTHKISSFAKSKESDSEMSMSESEDSSDDSLVPSLSVLKSKNSVQRKVDQRLKQLQDDSAVKLADATDFSWQNAKAAHAVLLCDIERRAISWQETSKIDRIRRPKNTHKILNLGPKIRIPAQVKSHGFAKHFKLVYVA